MAMANMPARNRTRGPVGLAAALPLTPASFMAQALPSQTETAITTGHIEVRSGGVDP